MVAVCDQAILIEAAEIEVTHLTPLFGGKGGHITCGVNPHVRVDRDPAVRGEINLRPIVIGRGAGKEVPAGLPARWYPVQTAEGDEKQSFLAAISIPMRAAILAEIRHGRILGGETVFNMIRNPIV